MGNVRGEAEFLVLRGVYDRGQSVEETVCIGVVSGWAAGWYFPFLLYESDVAALDWGFSAAVVDETSYLNFVFGFNEVFVAA